MDGFMDCFADSKMISIEGMTEQAFLAYVQEDELILKFNHDGIFRVCSDT
jgi:hypothetical protein